MTVVTIHGTPVPQRYPSGEKGDTVVARVARSPTTRVAKASGEFETIVMSGDSVGPLNVKDKIGQDQPGHGGSIVALWTIDPRR